MSETPAKRVPKWESDTIERIRGGLRKYIKPMQEMIARDANEADTRLIVTDILCELLGYDKYSELATEYMIRGDFADYGIRVDGTVLAMVEVKRIKTTLNKRHLRQLEMYGVNEGVEWLMLTNAQVWQVYRLIPGMPVTVDLVLEVDLLSDGETIAKKADKLAHMSKSFMKHSTLDGLWKVTAATAPASLAEVILSDTVLDAARKELRRRTGHAIDSADLGRLIRDSVILPDLVS